METPLLAIFLLAQLTFTTYGLDRVYVKDGMFTSREDGRTLMFRGINSVINRFPWYDRRMLDPERQQQLEDWGFNSIRLGMMWSGLEPEEGKVNETYAEIIKQTVDTLAEHGIYSYLDMHQDCLTAAYKYWGIPEWAGAKMDKPEHPYPWPMKSTSGYSTWGCAYLTQEISNAFHQLYTNNHGLADSFANFWKEVTKRFMNNPSVLGYELLNEPWTGDFYQDLSLLLPGNAGYNLLEPFFNRASDAIRSMDNETLIFWEPVTYAYFVNMNSDSESIAEIVLDAYLKTHNVSIFYPLLRKACGELDEEFISEAQLKMETKRLEETIKYAKSHGFNDRTIDSDRPSLLGPGFTAPPGGPEYLDRTVMSWHYYCWSIGYDVNDVDMDPLIRAECDDLIGPNVFRTLKTRAEELGTATFLTEFGICRPNAELTNSTATIECNFVLDQADLHLQSWSYWDTADGAIFWNSKGEPKLNTVKVFSRPYPPKTAGRPLKLKFDHETRLFEYTFQPDPEIINPTEIFVPPLIYTQGFEVEVPSGVTWEPSTDRKSIILVKTNDIIEPVTVNINPL